MNEELEKLKMEVENYRSMVLDLYMLRNQKDNIEKKIEQTMRGLTNLLIPSEILNKEKCCNKKSCSKKDCD